MRVVSTRVPLEEYSSTVAPLNPSSPPSLIPSSFVSIHTVSVTVALGMIPASLAPVIVAPGVRVCTTVCPLAVFTSESIKGSDP